MRQLVIDVWDVIYTSRISGDRANNKCKAIVFTQYPRTALWIHILFNFLGIKNLRLSSKMTPDTRWDQISKMFDGAGDQALVLIVPFSLQMMGMNLQNRCCHVFDVELVFNFATELQGHGRVPRHVQAVEQHIILSCRTTTVTAQLERTIIRKQKEIIMACITANIEAVIELVHNAIDSVRGFPGYEDRHMWGLLVDDGEANGFR